jgi:hypothetical protein
LCHHESHDQRRRDPDPEAARKREKSKAAFERDDAALRELFVEWRAQGVGPSDMARWSGMTREWVAKIAPLPKS